MNRYCVAYIASSPGFLAFSKPGDEVIAYTNVYRACACCSSPTHEHRKVHVYTPIRFMFTNFFLSFLTN